jgi:hypothetical protein
MNSENLGEVLFEFRQMGAALKVTAIHVDTGTEVVLLGAPNVGDHALKMAAIRKLVYVLNKREG